MPNFGAAFSISSNTYAAATAPDVDLTTNLTARFEPRMFEIYLSSASILAFSFDGVNDHGQLDGTNLKSTRREIKAKRMWLRLVSGTSPATGFVAFWT